MKQLKYLLSLSLISLIVFFSSCSELGRQTPVWEAGGFTPNGKYYVYVYSIYNVTSYSSSGGATYRGGSTENYFEVIDCSTGRKILDGSLDFDERIDIVDMSNDYVWLRVHDPYKSEYSLAIFDLAAGKLAFTAKEIRKLNPDIPFGQGRVYQRAKGQEYAIYEAEDGRQYEVNPKSGKLSLVQHPASPLAINLESALAYDDGFFQGDHSMPGIKTLREGGSRERLMLESDSSVRSKLDFLDPSFLAYSTRSFGRDPVSLRYKNSFFVLSYTVRSDARDMLLSRLDSQSLESYWTVTLPEKENDELSSYSNKARVFLAKKTLLLANQSYLMSIDLETGKINASQELLPGL